MGNKFWNTWKIEFNIWNEMENGKCNEMRDEQFLFSLKLNFVQEGILFVNIFAKSE